MSVNLLDTLNNEDSLGIPHWRDVVTEIYRTDPNGIRPSTRQGFVDYHATTARRIASADYHYHNLNQIYVPDAVMMGGFATIWTQIESESVIFMLYSALNSLMHEVNIAYGLGIPEYKVDSYHDPSQIGHQPRRCIRCLIDRQNSALSTCLNSEFSSPWFDVLRRLRNRIGHRQLLVTNTNFVVGSSTVYLEIPSDPDATRFTEQPRHGLEINSYCTESRVNVVRAIGRAYQAILSRVPSI